MLDGSRLLGKKGDFEESLAYEVVSSTAAHGAGVQAAPYSACDGHDASNPSCSCFCVIGVTAVFVGWQGVQQQAQQQALLQQHAGMQQQQQYAAQYAAQQQAYARQFEAEQPPVSHDKDEEEEDEESFENVIQAPHHLIPAPDLSITVRSRALNLSSVH